MPHFIRIAVVLVARVRDEEEANQAAEFYRNHLGDAIEQATSSESNGVLIETLTNAPETGLVEDWSNQPAGQFAELNEKKKRQLKEAADDMARDMRGEIQG